MSIKIMSEVWEHARVDGTDLLLLLAMADFANDDATCWPSIDTLAKRIRKAPRSVTRSVKSLEEKGLIEVLHRGAGRNSSRYKIVVSALRDTPESRGDNLSGVTQVSPQHRHGCHPSPDTGVTPALTPVSTDPSLNRQLNTSIEPPYPPTPQRGESATDHAFNQFWQAYPKKVSKGDALKAWKSGKCHKHLDVILVSLEKHKAWTEWTKDGGKFTPYPATWLRAMGWENEIRVVNSRSHATPELIAMQARIEAEHRAEEEARRKAMQ